MYDFSDVRAFLESLGTYGIPMSGLEVRHHHKVVFHEYFGYADTEKTKKPDDSTLVWLYSVSKVVTCIAAMRLVEEGKLSPDDKLSKYLPEFEHMKVRTKDGVRDAENPILIKHLFTMSSGFSYDPSENMMKLIKEKKDASTLEITRSLADFPLFFEPGTDYRYGFSHDLLAAVIEVVSGMTLGEYMRKIMFDPLEIENMGFHPSENDTARFAAQYKYDIGTYTSKPCPPGTPLNMGGLELPRTVEFGSGGLYSNLQGVSKIMDTVACGGTSENGYRLLRPETVALMEENRLPTRALKTLHYDARLHGYGWGYCGRVHMNPELSFSNSPKGEFGWDGAAASYVMIDRKNEIAISYITHVFDCHYIWQKGEERIRDLVYDAIK